MFMLAWKNTILGAIRQAWAAAWLVPIPHFHSMWEHAVGCYWETVSHSLVQIGSLSIGLNYLYSINPLPLEFIWCRFAKQKCKRMRRRIGISKVNWWPHVGRWIFFSNDIWWRWTTNGKGITPWSLVSH